jgi:hypothetical protein
MQLLLIVEYLRCTLIGICFKTNLSQKQTLKDKRFDLIFYEVSYDFQSYLTRRFDNKHCYPTFDQLAIANSRSVTNCERYARFGYIWIFIQLFWGKMSHTHVWDIFFQHVVHNMFYPVTRSLTHLVQHIAHAHLYLHRFFSFILHPISEELKTAFNNNIQKLDND